MPERTGRSSLRRPIEIDKLIRAGECPCAASLAERFEVDRRTVLRDLEWLRDQMGAPLRYDRASRQYRYDPPGFSLPALVVAEDEWVSLALLCRSSRVPGESPWSVGLGDFLRKVLPFVPEASLARASRLSSRVSWRAPAPRRHRPELFRVLVEALEGSERVRIRHRAAARGAGEERVVEPYHLLCSCGAWYLLGSVAPSGPVRAFPLSCLDSAVPTGEWFPPPDGFSAEAHLARAFDVVAGDPDPRGLGRYLVRLRFDAYASETVREEVRHSEVSRQETPSGLLISHRVDDLEEIAAWLLSWAGHVKVLGPETLRERLRLRLRDMMRIHGWTDG
jgi:predicted DNA-binding transcriptional regulator YafY